MFDRQRNSREVSREALSQHYRDTRVRQNLPRRTDRGLQLLPTHHGEVRVGEPDRRMYQRGHRQDERQRRRRLARAVFSIILLCFAACGRSNDPQDEFERVHQLFLHGDLIRAQIDSDKAYRYYSERDSQWSWKFRILNARILTWRGMYQDVLPLLNPELPSSLRNSALDLQKRQLQGLTYARLHRFTEAHRTLTQVAETCSISNSPIIGDVLMAQGSLEVERGEYRRAQDFFERSLQFVRHRQDRFSEAVALMKLSNTALLQERFEEAIDWSNAAYTAARALDARLIMEIVEGNLGWA